MHYCFQDEVEVLSRLLMNEGLEVCILQIMQNPAIILPEGEQNACHYLHVKLQQLNEALQY